MPKDHAVAVLLITPEGVPLIRDPKKPAPVYWKLPGGRGGAQERAAAAAVRELEEEIGLRLEEGALTLVLDEDRGSHVFSLFRANSSLLPPLKTRGDEGEEIKMFAPAEILKMKDFFPPHRKIAEKLLAADH